MEPIKNSAAERISGGVTVKLYKDYNAKNLLGTVTINPGQTKRLTGGYKNNVSSMRITKMARNEYLTISGNGRGISRNGKQLGRGYASARNKVYNFQSLNFHTAKRKFEALDNDTLSRLSAGKI